MTDHGDQDVEGAGPVPLPPGPDGPMPGVWRLWLVAAAGVSLDLVIPGAIPGIVAVIAMALVTVWVALRTRGVGWIGVGLAAVFGLARLWLVYSALFRPAAPPPSADAVRTYDLLCLVGVAIALLGARYRRHVGVWTGRLLRRPARMLVVSFALLIAVSTLLLVLPVSLQGGRPVSLLDALFTATSAVSVTGLAVNDVGSTYSWFGQLVLLLGVQLGGIGIMTIAALAAVLRRVGPLRDQARFAAVLEARRLGDLRHTVFGIITLTLLIEAAGAGLLFLLWSGDPALGDRSAVWAAVFHAVSAFCNAGFALWPTSLGPHAGSPASLAVVMGLIVLGGLGFPVLLLLFRRDRSGAGAARVALVVSVVLIVVGAAAFSVLESGGVLRDMALGDRLVNALFASVTSRTAGFATVDVGRVGAATLIVVMGLMFVGGSPGSTAGGIKTTTAAVLFAALRGELQGREPVLGRRAVPPTTVRRAAAVLSMSLVAVFAACLLLALTESHPLPALLFEVVSAFTTTGLSTGITPDLSPAGKLIVLLAMFVGRVGPITVAIAVADRYQAAPHRLPPEDLPIG